MKTIYLFLAVLAVGRAEILPPTQSVDRRFEIVAVADGTPPFTYQWYRGTATKPFAVKIPAPEGVQQTLTLEPPNVVAGIYVCVITNSVGSCENRKVKVSITKVLTAIPVVVTFKQP